VLTNFCVNKQELFILGFTQNIENQAIPLDRMKKWRLAHSS
jgi:hypothetical protein